MEDAIYNKLAEFLPNAIRDVHRGYYRRIDNVLDSAKVAVYRVGDYVRVDVHGLPLEPDLQPDDKPIDYANPPW